MGFITGSIRLLYLTQLKNDLQYKMALITEAKLDMSKNISELTPVGTDMDPDSPVIQAMKARRDKMKIIEDQLDRQLVIYQSKLDAVKEEIKSAQAIVKEGTQSFNYAEGR